jgi:hypothetical protein
MNQIPAGISSSPVPELNFWSDWTKSLPIVIETVTVARIPVIAVLATTLGQMLLPGIPGWNLLQTIIMFFVLSKLMQITYQAIVPQSRDRADLFPAKPELKMLGAAILVNIGTMIGICFFIVPGVWFALIHMMTQEIIVLEGCGIIEAMSKSRQLMAGNLWSIALYCGILPIAVSIALLIAMGIVAVIFYLGAKTIMSGGAGQEIIKNMLVAVFTIVFLGFGLTFKTLAVRAFVYLMHISGNRTAIEQQLGNNNNIEMG